MKGSRTAIISLILVVLGAVQGFDFATLISDPVIVGRVVSGIGIVMLVLRAMTDTAILNDK
jgi:hypothetical protein